jgi:hypothetical protein
MTRAARVAIGLGGLLTGAPCFAGGTVDLEHVDRLLAEQPAVRSFLRSTMDLEPTAFAEVRFGLHFGHLGGARMGPYTIRAHPRGATAGTTLEVVLCTAARFLDESGKPVADEPSAFRLEEKLTAVMIREATGASRAPDCP